VIVVVASIKGAPGVTTTATALAESWPSGRRVLLVEVDPFGGDLAAWFGAAPSTGLWSLLAAGRRGLDPHAVWEHAATSPTGLPVLYGLATADQAVANEAAWPAVAGALAALEGDVIIDAGRLLPHFAGGIGPLLSLADVLLVLCPPTLAGIVHLKAALPSLTATSTMRRTLVLPTAQKGFSSEEIAATLKINVAPPIPHDPRGAAALGTSTIGSARSKSPLAKWARRTSAELVASSPTALGSQVSLAVAETKDALLAQHTDDPLHSSERRPVARHLNTASSLDETDSQNDAPYFDDTEQVVLPTWAAR
jgi:MinD-like ATPase involved in chromosome partitioning or flagellar assembly